MPKPGEARTLQNLTPVSLTSCIGKLLENVLHIRLTKYIEGYELLSYNRYGFRQHLSTQDIFVRLRDDVLHNIATARANIMATLDLKSAFGTISHTLVIAELERIGWTELRPKITSALSSLTVRPQ